MLFPREELDAFAASAAPSTAELVAAMERLRVLQARKLNGVLRPLGELNVEQSFNERVFAEVFGYRTLFRHGIGDYEFKPKTYVEPLVRGNKRRFPDFTLGFYGASDGTTVATGELKPPDTPLDEKQSGYGTSPVEQALVAAAQAQVAWALVTNCEELRLYRVESPQGESYEAFSFDDLSPQAFRRAFALFSRRSMLGEPGSLSPLERFYQRVHRGNRMYLPRIDGRVRLAMTAARYPVDVEEMLPLSRIAKALGASVAERFRPLEGPRMDGDVVTYRVSSPTGPQFVANASAVGALHLSHYIENGLPGGPNLTANALVRSLGLMLASAARFFRGAKVGHFTAQVMLLDLTPAAKLWSSDKDQWLRPPAPRADWCAPCLKDVERIVYSFPVLPSSAGLAKGSPIPGLFAEACRELMFPFVYETDAEVQCRIDPADAEVDAIAAPILGAVWDGSSNP